MPTAVPYQVTYSARPVAVPTKTPYYKTAAQTATYRVPTQSTTYRTAARPTPSVGSSVNTSAVPSLTASSASSSTNGAKARGQGSVDLVEMMSDRLSTVVNPAPLDQTLAQQAQTSGELNAKQRELQELQQLAQRRMKSARANFADGMKAAKQVRTDLAWTQKRVSQLNAQSAKRHPAAYKAATAKYPSLQDD